VPSHPGHRHVLWAGRRRRWRRPGSAADQRSGYAQVEPRRGPSPAPLCFEPPSPVGARRRPGRGRVLLGQAASRCRCRKMQFQRRPRPQPNAAGHPGPAGSARPAKASLIKLRAGRAPGASSPTPSRARWGEGPGLGSSIPPSRRCDDGENWPSCWPQRSGLIARVKWSRGRLGRRRSTAADLEPRGRGLEPALKSAGDSGPAAACRGDAAGS